MSFVGAAELLQGKLQESALLRASGGDSGMVGMAEERATSALAKPAHEGEAGGTEKRPPALASMKGRQ